MKKRGCEIVAGAAGEPPHNREEWGDYRENGARGIPARRRETVTPNGIGTQH